MPAATTDTTTYIPPIRHASRQLIREWGFLRPTLAGTTLSAPAVHCLLEIGDYNISTISELCHVLAIEKAELKRTLYELVSTGDVQSEWTGQEQVVSITAKGRETLAAINQLAADQVQKALAVTPPAAADRILDGLKLYAEALQAERLRSIATGLTKPAYVPEIRIVAGYTPGVLGRTLDMHLNYYWRTWQWGHTFEVELSTTLTRLLEQINEPMNQVWAAVESSPYTGGVERIVGVIWLEGASFGPKHGQLRAFIVEDHLRGLGVGRRLFESLMERVVQLGLDKVSLYTSRDLVSARKLYEEGGFVLHKEEEVLKWGQTTRTMEYIWTRESQLKAQEQR